MTRQYIELGRDGWYLYIYYGVNRNNINEISSALRELECPEQYIRKALRIMSLGVNTGLTYSNTSYRTSIVCIGDANSKDQFVNTIVHEAKHVQSHICQYYDINEDSEQAAYLIGYIVQRMYKALKKIEYQYYG